MRIPLLVFCAAVTAATTPLVAQDALGREPVTLLQVLDSVAARYPSIEAATARIRAARGSRSTAGTLGNPVLMYQVENAPLPGRSAPPMDREMMVTAMLPLEPLYQRWSRVSGANAEVRAAEADARAERQRTGMDATHAFYRMARAQVAMETARDLAAWLDSVVAYNRTRVHEGVAAEADLIRSELERDRAEADASMQEADLARARADLSVFLGDQPAPATLRVVALDAPLALPDVSLTSRAGATRPDIRAARERVTAAGAGVTTERTSLIRQLGLTIGTKRSAGTTSLIAGVSMPFPLFDQNRGAIARAAAEREAAAFELAAQERIGRAEIAGASESARLLTERAGVLAGAARGQGYLARAEEARRIALGAYREGAVPLIQVIDAARAWGEAQLVYYQILYAQHESIVQLLVAEGVDVASALPALTIGAEARP
jgi:cobalt-zinc-cadmium efflux system outer membrane protein